MLDTRFPLERALQLWRFRVAKPWLLPPILDVGGNRGELGSYIGLNGRYAVCNDISEAVRETHLRRYETVALLATLEHLDVRYVSGLRLGQVRRIVVTTPAPRTHFLLTLLARLRFLDPANIAEHKHYYGLPYLQHLFPGHRLVHYERFEFGLNQLAVYDRG